MTAVHDAGLPSGTCLIHPTSACCRCCSLALWQYEDSRPLLAAKLLLAYANAPHPCGPAALTQFTHHGIIFVPLGYTVPNDMQYGMDEVQVRGSSAMPS